MRTASELLAEQTLVTVFAFLPKKQESSSDSFWLSKTGTKRSLLQTQSGVT